METMKRRKPIIMVWGDSLAKGVIWNAERCRHGYAERKGGYIRMVGTGVRRGDAAETAVIELVK